MPTKIKIKIGDITTAVEWKSGQSDFDSPRAYQPFLSNDRTDIRLGLHLDLPKNGSGEKIFDSAPIWSFYRDSDAACIHIFEQHPDLLRFLVLPLYFKKADLLSIDPVSAFKYISSDSNPTKLRKIMSKIRIKTIQGLAVGDTFVVTRKFTEADMRSFADVTRDYNPIHFEKRFADVKNFKARICHGLLVGSILTEVGGQIGWLASEMNFRFKRPVYFGDTIECTFTISKIDARNRARAKAIYCNQDGTVVLEADLAGIIPGEPEKEVLEAMVANGDSTNKNR